MKLLLLFFFFTPLSVISQEFNEYQVNIHVKKSDYELKRSFLTTGAISSFKKGNSNGYLEIICKKTERGITKKLSSNIIFSGYKIKSEINANTIYLQIEEHIVKSQDEAIQKLNRTECKNISAEVLINSDLIEFSLDKLPVKSILLKNGKVLNLNVIKIL